MVEEGDDIRHFNVGTVTTLTLAPSPRNTKTTELRLESSEGETRGID